MELSEQVADILTHENKDPFTFLSGQVMPYGKIKLGQHWFR